MADGTINSWGTIVNSAEFIQLAEKILEADEGTLSLSDLLDDVDWDSLADIAFMADADSKLGVTVNPENLKASKTLADVYALISA